MMGGVNSPLPEKRDATARTFLAASATPYSLNQLAEDHRTMKQKSIFPAILFGLSLLLAGNLSACNTVKGAGQDIKAVGRTIESKAEEKKSY
jgi:predicted small secreted protein